jgi:hypothetical protein
MAETQTFSSRSDRECGDLVAIWLRGLEIHSPIFGILLKKRRKASKSRFICGF